ARAETTHRFDLRLVALDLGLLPPRVPAEEPAHPRGDVVDAVQTLTGGQPERRPAEQHVAERLGPLHGDGVSDLRGDAAVMRAEWRAERRIASGERQHIGRPGAVHRPELGEGLVGRRRPGSFARPWPRTRKERYGRCARRAPSDAARYGVRGLLGGVAAGGELSAHAR